MKKGQVTTIYQKPITKEESEGEAKLISKIMTDKIYWDSKEYSVELWNVIFLEDSFKAARFIRID